MNRTCHRNLLPLALAGCLLSAGAIADEATATALAAREWRMWGGSPARNQVNTVEKGLPAQWDVKSGKNVKWSTALGSQSYGNPVFAKGRILLGTNNEGRRDPAIQGDKGNIFCLQESDGAFLWQIVHDKLKAGRVNDWPLQGICSSPTVVDDRFYYVGNRCEVVCADLQGLAEGKNQGVTDEVYQGEQHGDMIWRLDMIEELGVFPHNIATSSPLVIGDLVFAVTGNGVDEGHLNLPAEIAPSFVAVNRHTGELAWEFACEERILHGQWSSPAYGELDGRAMVIMPGGDGWVYALDPPTGTLLWKFDCNPKDSIWELGGYGTRNNLIATPVFHNGRVYIGVGQDPEHGIGIGNLWSIDASGSGDVTATHAKWHFGDKEFGRTMSTVSILDGLLYVCDLEGHLYCLDADVGTLVWKHNLQAQVWASTMVADGKVYIGTEDGLVYVFAHGREKQLLGRMQMGDKVYSTPVAVNGVLYVMSNSRLFALEQKE
jgi:outer membrane protein assembly factor BamB